MCSNFLFQFSVLSRILPPIENKSRHTGAKGDYAESNRNAPKRNELRENERISIDCEIRGSRQEVPQLRAARTCATLVYLIRTYIITYVYIYIFYMYIFFVCVHVCMYVCICVYVLWKRRRYSHEIFEIIKTQTYAGKRDVHIGLAWKKIHFVIIERRVHVRIFTNLPGDVFSDWLDNASNLSNR